ATIMERLSGERFDLYMKKHVLDPLGIEAAYNINLLGDAAFANLGALYRKAPGSEGPWDQAGPWIPQTDDYRGARPELAQRYQAGPEGQVPALAAYSTGSNGTMFSPQGGLRISIRDYAGILRIFMEGGRCGGIRVLDGQSVCDMMTPRWRYDPAAANGNSYYGMTRESGLALFHTTDSRDDMGCDRLIPQGGLKMWGHHGDAYGYLGAALFDPGTNRGLVYAISGTAADPMINRGSYSSWFVWEELIQKTVLEGIFGYGRKV
ncbi:MAG: serine hydrolase, partial [Rectinemataceae bacterium]|nr:serine hydrolase [Rectinemataceae bacterium]